MVIRGFPYNEKEIYWNDKTINSYNALSKKGYSVYSTKVETIEDIDDILLNNINENIIYWINCDVRLLEKIETNTNSKITIVSKRF